MRHGKKQNSLGRKSAHRKAMLSNMACSLIEHKRINTTVAKAKALRKYLEPIITKSKSDSTHSRRMVFSYLQNKDAVTELFREVSPKIMNRPGGYLRIIRLGNRQGDNAEMCMIELVDFNEVMVKEDKSKKTRRSRRGSGGAKKVTEPAENKTSEVGDTDTPKTDAKSDAPKADKKGGDAKKEAPKAKVAKVKAEDKDKPKKAAAPKAEKKTTKKDAPKKEDNEK